MSLSRWTINGLVQLGLLIFVGELASLNLGKENIIYKDMKEHIITFTHVKQNSNRYVKRSVTQFRFNIIC